MKLYKIRQYDVDLLDQATENLKEYIKAGKGDEKLRQAVWNLLAIIPRAISEEPPKGAA